LAQARGATGDLAVLAAPHPLDRQRNSGPDEAGQEAGDQDAQCVHEEDLTWGTLACLMVTGLLSILSHHGWMRLLGYTWRRDS
jgi:hypothetical protein